MGVMDRVFGVFKKRGDKGDINQNAVQKEESPYEIKYDKTNDGRLVVELYDKNAPFGQGYDTTKLVMREEQFDLGGKPVNNCMASWYNENDCEYLDENGRPYGSRADYTGFLATIDAELLKTNKEYCEFVMKSFLNRNDVSNYIEMGLTENPRVPCGKYIGGVEQTNGGPMSVFDSQAGRASHYSKLMIDRRQRIAEERSSKVNRQILDKEAEIKRLQDEVNKLSGGMDGR